MAAASRDKWCHAQMYITSHFLTSGATITVKPGKCSKRAVRRCSVKETGILRGSAVTHTHTHRAFWLMDMWFQHWHGCQDAESFSWRRERQTALFCFLAQFSTCVVWNNVKGSVVIFAFCHTSHYSLHSDSVCPLWNLQHFPHLYLL